MQKWAGLSALLGRLWDDFEILGLFGDDVSLLKVVGRCRALLQPCTLLDSIVKIRPNGKGKSPMGGHKVNFNDEGEQWAPIGGLDNAWVQIVQLHDNVATTCMTYHELTGQHGPTWGLRSCCVQSHPIAQCIITMLP